MSSLFTLQKLKTELQGTNGLVQQVRKLYIPTGERLAEETWKHISFAGKKLTSAEVKQNFNNYLSELIDTEYKLYLEYEEKCISQGVIELSLSKEIESKFPNVFMLLNSCFKVLEDNSVSRIKKLSGVGAKLRPFYKLVEQSFAQGRMARAGGSSQNHLKTLLEKAGYKGEFEMQQVLNGTVDFLFPSKKVWNKDKRKCIIVSIKRTLRERYKQVFEELEITGGIPVYLLVTETYQESLRDITNPKVDKLNSQNIYLVVRDGIKEKRFKKKENVVSFSSFIQDELPSKQTQWSKLIRK